MICSVCCVFFLYLVSLFPSAVNKRYRQRTHKYGIRVPKSVHEAFEIDRENGDTKWADAIQKEMNNVRVAFHVLDDTQAIPPGYQYMACHTQSKRR
jgi:hypothetical protein